MYGSKFLPSTFFKSFEPDFFNLFELYRDSAGSYPPYNVVKRKEGDKVSWLIEVALAGFKEEDIIVQQEGRTLRVASRHQSSTNSEEPTPIEDTVFLHRGVAKRAFSLMFDLPNHLEITEAIFEDGMLKIDLELVIPEELKPKLIPLNKKK